MTGAGIDRAARERTRRRLPGFVREVVDDPVGFRTLLAAAAALAAVGFDPHVLDPGMPTMREAIKQEPWLQDMFMLTAVVQAGFVLLGGFLGDAFRSRRLVRIALFGLVATSVLAVLFPGGWPLLVVRFVAWGLDGIVLPFAIGAVAMVYTGRARATALGVVYAVYGAGAALAPALAMLLGAAGPRWPAFAACAVAALLGIRMWRGFPRLQAAPREHRRTVAAVTLFAFGVVALAAGLISVSTVLHPIRLLVDAAGIVAIAASLTLRSAARGAGDPGVALRPVAVALAAGVVIGFAQAAPMLHLPLYFMLVQGASPVLAAAAIAPFVVALLAAGPVSGWMLARFGPRTLIAGGVLVVALADLGVAIVIGRTTPYLAFILPYLMIGAGFVIGTTVRTAIIFASVPRELPASAAAFNEASLGLGSRLGVVVATVVMANTAVASFRSSLGGVPAEAVDRLVGPFREVVVVLGLPQLDHAVAALGQAARTSYQDALIAGWQMSELVPAAIGLVAAVLVFLALGRGDPLRTVWDLADERSEAGPETGG